MVPSPPFCLISRRICQPAGGLLLAALLLCTLAPVSFAQPSLPSPALKGDTLSIAPETLLSSPILRETAYRQVSFNYGSEDRWLAPDKAKHVGASLLVTLSSQYAFVNKGGWSEHDALPLSVGTGALAGLSKEFYDRHVGPTRHFCLRDLAADAVGILLAVGFILL